MTDKEIAKELTIALIQNMDLIKPAPASQITTAIAIEKNGESIAQLYKTIYECVSSL